MPLAHVRCRIALRGWAWTPGAGEGGAGGYASPFAANYTVPLRGGDDHGAEFSATLPGLADGSYEHLIEVRARS